MADNRRLWIRINTCVGLGCEPKEGTHLTRIKNSRIIAEFREIDSYLTESDSDSDWNERPSLAQKEFDNSILKMGRGLLQAAKANPVEVTGEIPRVLLRLTRLDTTAINDPRIDQTLKMLTEMGIQVELGERIEEELPLVFPLPQRPQPLPHLLPSFRVNLDLSALIALISDLTHAALPRSMDEAKRRFIPPKEYLDWKEKRRQRANHANQADGVGGQGGESIAAVEHLPHDLATHSRALRNQLLQEMSKSMIHELRDRFSSIPGYGRVDLNGSLPPVEFWTTTEARDRCLRIVSKIGGVNEKRRAYSLFCLNPSSPRQPIPVPEAEKCFWEGSRFEHGSLPLFPLHFHSSDIMKGSPLLDQREKRRSFMKGLAQTCKDILDQENTKSGNGRNDFISQATAFPTSVDAASNQCSTTPNIDYLASEPGRGLDSQSASSHKPGIHRKEDQDCEIPRATVMKANAKLTAHTVESLLWGAELGWTTLTANRTSVKAILKEMKAARFSGRLEVEDDDAIEEELQDGQRDTEVAAIWIVDPRSLAEQMSGGGSM